MKKSLLNILFCMFSLSFSIQNTYSQTPSLIYHNVVLPEKKLNIYVSVGAGFINTNSKNTPAIVNSLYGFSGSIRFFKGKILANVSYDSAKIPDPESTSKKELNIITQKRYGHQFGVDFGYDIINSKINNSNFTYLTIVPTYHYIPSIFQGIGNFSLFFGLGISKKITGVKQYSTAEINNNYKYAFGSKSYIDLKFGSALDLNKKIAIGLFVKSMMATKPESFNNEKYFDFAIFMGLNASYRIH